MKHGASGFVAARSSNGHVPGIQHSASDAAGKGPCTRTRTRTVPTRNAKGEIRRLDRSPPLHAPDFRIVSLRTMVRE